MKIVHIVLKVLLSLLIITPILGLTGVFPPPTRDLYHSEAAFAFINMLMNSAIYIDYIMCFVFLVSVVLLFTKREALAALLILPITVNIVGFHAFLDGGLLTGGSIPALLLLGLNIYFLWKNCNAYTPLWKTK